MALLVKLATMILDIMKSLLVDSEELESLESPQEHPPIGFRPWR
jgi:hypothetical protein